MKALVLADLHINTKVFMNNFDFNKFKRTIKNNIKEDYDIVLIAGDLCESSICNRDIPDIYDKLYNIFEKDIVFCLGNHEFAYMDFNFVKEFWSKYKHDHVHCLDIDGKYEKDNITFIGNVFWYDFSLNNNQLLMQGEIDPGWLDATIKNFDPIFENQKCKAQILENISSINKNILITHMVPHESLNLFSLDMPYSIYNAYSGCKDFLKELKDFKIDYAICGHTHKRVCKEINGINCINVGNDYFFRTNKYEYMIIDI